MDWLDALILGIVQGLAEYLPISSSGHLEIFRNILGIRIASDQTLMFDVMVHAATVLSTIVVLRKMFFRLCRSFFTFRRDEDFYYVCKILVSCIPIASQPCSSASPISPITRARERRPSLRAGATSAGSTPL